MLWFAIAVIVYVSVVFLMICMSASGKREDQRTEEIWQKRDSFIADAENYANTH